MTSIVSSAIALIMAYKYAIIIPIAILEGPVVAVICGFLVSLGLLNVFLVFLIVIAGDLVGDAIHYAIGYAIAHHHNNGAPRWLTRYFSLSEHDLAMMKHRFAKHRIRTLIFAKWTHVLGFAALITAGIVRLDFWEFMFINFIAIIPKSIVLLLVGYYFGQTYLAINTTLKEATIAALVVAVLALVGYAIYRAIRSRIETEENIA